MGIRSAYPVIVTGKLEPARDFYTGFFGFKVVFEVDWYVQLHAPREDTGHPVELAFMKPNQLSQPAPLHEAFGGSGVILTLELEEIDDLYRKLGDNGFDFIVDLRDEEWGQRHFLLRDPAGTLLDVVQRIPPTGEYAEAYS